MGNFLEFSCLKFLQFLDFLRFYVLLNSFPNLFFYYMKILWTNEFWVYKNSWVLIFGWIFTKLEFGQKYTYSFFKTRTWINLITLTYRIKHTCVLFSNSQKYDRVCICASCLLANNSHLYHRDFYSIVSFSNLLNST